MTDFQNTQKSDYEIYEIIREAKEWPLCNRFDFEDPIIDPIFLSNSLQMTMYENNGIALSAPQIGINTRVIFIRGFGSALFNPNIVQTGLTQTTIEEISLSYPKMPIKIKRPDVIRVRYSDALGNVQSNTFMGLTSRAIQRKISFLDGELFYKEANKYHLEKAKKKSYVSQS